MSDNEEGKRQFVVDALALINDDGIVSDYHEPKRGQVGGIDRSPCPHSDDKEDLEEAAKLGLVNPRATTFDVNVKGGFCVLSFDHPVTEVALRPANAARLATVLIKMARWLAENEPGGESKG